MAKKDKNSLLNIHYSRTITPDNLSKAANYVGEYFLKGLGTLGKFLNAGFTSPTYGTTGQVNYARNTEDVKRLRELSEASEQAMGKAMTWVSPLNYGAAVWNGHGLNAKKGEEEVASWSPAWQAVGRLGELYVGPKTIKGVKSAPKVVVNTAAKAGVKPAKAAVVAREINKGIKLNTKNGRIEVTGNYFNSPDKWYRITETPEKYGIMELGKNVTTHDASQTYGTINGWRSSILRAPITKSSEGFIKRPHKIELGIRRKNGQAHGNTSQAAKGKLWGGTTSGSNLFPEGIIEGQAPSIINYGIDRTNFVITPWELVPNGGRVGFHTGEMPMSNLGWFQRTNKGTYTYEPIIPEKRITVEPSNNWTLNLPGREDYSMTKKSAYSGYTPTKLNSALSKFVRDVMQGYRWGRNREIKPTGNKDFTEQLKGKKRLGYGAENNVYEDISNPNQILKIPGNGLVTPHNTLKGAIREGLFISTPFNRLPYNLPLNVEGAVRTSEGKYIPVFSQRKVYIPLIMLPKINDFDRSVYGMYSYFGKPDVNNILSENDIPLALDFKLDNIGLLSDGTVMGIDLWKQGGKMNAIEQFKNGGQVRKMQTAAGGPINYKRWDDAKITSYTIPFIKEKAIKLTNAGRATGAVLSTNLLDSLADNAMRAGVPIRTAIGISTKETTLGNPTDTKSAWNLSSRIRREFNDKYPGTHLHINPGRDLNERELVINYHKGHLSDTDTLGKSVILEALEFYKQHPDKYNTNQSDYLNLVNIIGEEVMKSPEVLKWYREWEKSKAQIFRPKPYKINTNIHNTTLEFVSRNKQGGKMNILEFLKKGSGIHIKKKNRGKFTSYCGGKVTDECIKKAKASGNPTLVKRATFAANARKWKHLNGGILKALLGTNLDVDNLVDTTRKGWGKLPYFGAANNSNTAGLWDLLNYNVTKDSNVITGAPEILPGRVGMLEKEAPTIYNMIVEYGKNIKDGYRGIWNGTNYKNLYDTLRDFFKTGDKNILTLLENWAKKNKDTFVRGNISESIPKGFIKGNEVTTVGKETASEAGLSIRDTKLGNMNNPPTNPSEKIAVEDWNKMNPNNQISSKLPTGRPSYELKLDGLKIDIRYPKLTLPLLKKLNSPILKIEQRAPKKTTKERYLERKETPSKNIRKKDSYNLSYEDGDIRHVNSGNRRITVAQDKEDWDALGKYSTFSKKHHNIELRLSKYDKGTPAYKLAWKERKALILEYREKFRFRLKKGGVFRIGVNARKLKYLEGGTIINQSPIVAQYMLWLLNLPYLLSLLMELNLQKKMLDLLEKLLKMETTNSIFNTISNLGTTFLSNYLNKKNGAPSNT